MKAMRKFHAKSGAVYELRMVHKPHHSKHAKHRKKSSRRHRRGHHK